jgi:hypothetical protein
MKCVELNPVGNFDSWEPLKLEELKSEEIGGSLSSNLIFENQSIKLFSFTMQPYDRLPFRQHGYDFSWTCPTGGLAISRNSNGKIMLLRIDQGDTGYHTPEKNSSIFDLENIGENLLEIMMIEHKTLTCSRVNVLRS